MSALLRFEEVVSGYGRGDILCGFDLDVKEGAVTCLVGPNGAGKSTVLKTLSGLLKPRQGRIVFEGEEIGGLSPARVLARGIVHVPQDRSLFPLMSVWDNLLMGGHSLRDRRVVRRRADEPLSRRDVELASVEVLGLEAEDRDFVASRRDGLRASASRSASPRSSAARWRSSTYWSPRS